MNSHGGGGGSFAGSQLGVNLAYTKFFFVTPARDDEAVRARLRAAGGFLARGFFNDFDAEGRDSPPHETIQFLVRADPGAAQLPPKGGSHETAHGRGEPRTANRQSTPRCPLPPEGGSHETAHGSAANRLPRTAYREPLTANRQPLTGNGQRGADSRQLVAVSRKLAAGSR
jgi:hypothetical protein